MITAKTRAGITDIKNGTFVNEYTKQEYKFTQFKLDDVDFWITVNQDLISKHNDFQIGRTYDFLLSIDKKEYAERNVIKSKLNIRISDVVIPIKQN